jgi:dihydrofolate reductase
MRVSIVVAMTPDRVIGKDGTLPWRLPADLKHFRRLTLGHPVVMGRKTFESIGKPLDGRTNIVMTRRAAWEAPGCLVASTLDQALELATQHAAPTREVMILGGAAVYALFLPHADRMYVTWVDARVQGDTFFPRYDVAEWRESAREDHTADERNPHAYSFRVLERVSGRSDSPSRHPVVL